ncbi:6-aminohexanoate-dimer hydrolase [compost metagenome]
MQQLSNINTLSAASTNVPALRSSPAQNNEKLKLLHAADEDIHQHYPKMHSFIVAQQGALLIERYYNGFDASKLHDLRSATKSILSILLGIANHHGQLPPLDEPILHYVQKFGSRPADPLWAQLTLRHLLAMTTGFHWKTGAKMGEAFIHRFHQSRSWTKYITQLSIEKHKIGTFQYCSVDSHLLSILLTEWTGLSASDYAGRYLFEPLGIEQTEWSTSPDGHSTGHIGLHLTARDMTKIGTLCLQDGVWEQQRILSADWLLQSMSPISEECAGYGRYGYHWWTAKVGGITYAYAHGHGGQQIIVIPPLDSVIVFTADSALNRWKNPRPLLEKYVIPALKHS